MHAYVSSCLLCSSRILGCMCVFGWILGIIVQPLQAIRIFGAHLQQCTVTLAIVRPCLKSQFSFLMNICSTGGSSSPADFSWRPSIHLRSRLWWRRWERCKLAVPHDCLTARRQSFQRHECHCVRVRTDRIWKDVHDGKRFPTATYKSGRIPRHHSAGSELHFFSHLSDNGYRIQRARRLC